MQCDIIGYTADMSEEISFAVTWLITPEGLGLGAGVWLALSPQSQGPTIPYPMDVRVRKGRDGRLICAGLRIGWLHDAREEEITPTSFHSIPLGQILGRLGLWLVEASELQRSLADPGRLPEEMVERVLAGVKETEAGGEFPRDLLDEIMKRSQPAVPLFVPHPAEFGQARKRVGRPGRSTAFYGRIADTYRKALEVDPRHPYRYVVAHVTEDDGSLVWEPTEREVYLISREATARKWVFRARKLKIMGPGLQGKAGEYPPTRDDEGAEPDEPTQ